MICTFLNFPAVIGFAPHVKNVAAAEKVNAQNDAVSSSDDFQLQSRVYRVCLKYNRRQFPPNAAEGKSILGVKKLKQESPPRGQRL